MQNNILICHACLLAYVYICMYAAVLPKRKKVFSTNGRTSVCKKNFVIVELTFKRTKFSRGVFLRKGVKACKQQLGRNVMAHSSQLWIRKQQFVFIITYIHSENKPVTTRDVLQILEVGNALLSLIGMAYSVGVWSLVSNR